MTTKRKEFYFLIQSVDVKLYPLTDARHFRLKTEREFVTTARKSKFEWLAVLRDKFGRGDVVVVYL